MASIISFAVLYLLLNVDPEAVRGDPGVMPVRPFANCRLLISEFNIHSKIDFDKFVELYMACETGKSFPGVKMAKFALLFITGTGYLVGTCRFPETKVINPSGFFVIGHQQATFAEDDELIIDSGVRNCMLDHFYTNFPAGIDVPMGIALVFHRNKSPLDVFNLLKVDYKYTKKLLTQDLIKRIRDYLQDFHIYGSSTPTTQCDVFGKIYDGYLPHTDKILRDWETSSSFGDRSLSRCGENNLPFQINAMKYCVPSPGKANLCSNCPSFFVEQSLPEISDPLVNELQLEGPSLCYVEFEADSIVQEGTIVEPEDFANRLQRQEIDETADNNFEASRGGGIDDMIRDAAGKLIWTNCNALPRELQEELDSEGYFNLKQILSDDVCYWFDYLFNFQSSRCKFCDHVINVEKLINDRPGSKLITRIMRPAGYKPEGSNRKQLITRAIRDHLSNKIHEISLDYFKLKDELLDEQQLLQKFKRPDGPYFRYYLQTRNLMIATFQAVRMSLTFYNFNLYTDVLKFFDAKVGHVYHNAHGMRTVAVHISNQMHLEFLQHLRQDSPQLTIILDTTTDVSGLNVLAILMQTFNHLKKLETYFYCLIELTEGEAGDDIFDKFIEQVDRDNLIDVLKSNLVGLTCDGASSLSGPFLSNLQTYLGRPILYNHCRAHRLQLVINHAYKKFKAIQNIDKVINSLYNLISKSSKQKILLRQIQLELQEEQRKFELKRIYKIRWISSNNRAAKTILNNWKVIVTTLQAIWEDRSLEREFKYKSSIILDWLKDNTFLLHMAFLTDISDALTDLSLELQKRNTAIIGKRYLRSKIISKLQNLKVDNGVNVKRLFRNAFIGHRQQSFLDLGLTFRDFERNDIVYLQVPLVQTYPSPEANYLFENKDKYIESLVREINSYFGSDVTDNFDIFYPTYFEAAKHTSNLGKKELLELKKFFKWGYDDDELYQNYRNLVIDILEDENYNTNKLISPETFWQNYLQLSDNEIRWTTMLRDIVKKTLTIAQTSSEVERVFSFYTREKSKRRFCLLVSTVDALIRIKFNGVKSLTSLQADRYAYEFIKEHSRADDTSRVGTHTPLPCDENLFANLVDGNEELTVDDIDED